MAVGEQTPPGARAPVWIPVAVALVVLACFAPVLRCDFIANWDDDLNVLNNEAYRGLSLEHVRWMATALYGGHYHPLTWLTFAVDYTLWGLDPTGYHLTNLLLHTANALLVYALALALLSHAGAGPARAPVARAGAAAVAALSFAIHPLRVESVAWVTERRDVLSAFFLLLTVLAYLRMAAARSASVRRTWVAASLGCFTLSLLSKAWGMTLPAVLLVLDVYPLSRHLRGATWSRLLLEKLPFAALAAGAMILAALAQMQVGEFRTLEQHGVGARLTQAAYGVLFYLWKTVAPIQLSPLYPLPRDFTPTALPYLGAAIGVVAVTLTLVVLRRRWPWALAAWGIYVIILAPVLGVLQTGPQLVADRYTYLACLPWSFLAAAAVCTFHRLRRPTGVVVSAAVLIVWGGLSVRQIGVWTNAETLWDHALRLDPASDIANVNRGWIQLQRNDLAGALAYYNAALQANPRFTVAYRARGIARLQNGDFRGAIADLGASLENEPHAGTYLNRALARQALGDADGAMADYTAALALDPADPQAYNNRGWLRREGGDVRGAIADFEQAVAVAPPDWPYKRQAEENLREARAQADRARE